MQKTIHMYMNLYSKSCCIFLTCEYVKHNEWVNNGKFTHKLNPLLKCKLFRISTLK